MRDLQIPFSIANNRMTMRDFQMFLFSIAKYHRMLVQEMYHMYRSLLTDAPEHAPPLLFSVLDVENENYSHDPTSLNEMGGKLLLHRIFLNIVIAYILSHLKKSSKGLFSNGRSFAFGCVVRVYS